MREIPLTQGYVTIVDDEDYDQLIVHRWKIQKNRKPGLVYAARNYRWPGGRQGLIMMHRQILGLKKGDSDVDHKDGDGLNNTRENLRLCTDTQNQANSWREGASGFRGVGKVRNSWRAQIQISGKRQHLGYFPSPEDAARAYDTAATELYGEFARLNFQ